ncbi:hypothetical protein ANN_27708 [Periplaneta americana]|uniref:Uncharacterized protein n=1 Tax=Periplaneta americana TaxID=6978 RepID=A0ABQ8RUX3_PERAM|nr:hypothetical protein ANN_27708 [Periplaneta americana]
MEEQESLEKNSWGSVWLKNDAKHMKKRNRGAISFAVTQDDTVVRWHDNNIVILASNCHNVTPILKADRVSVIAGKRSKIQVDCPSVIE